MGGTSTISGGKLCLRIDPRVPTLSGCAASRGPTIKANTVPFSWIMASIHEGLVKDWQRTQLAGYISKESYAQSGTINPRFTHDAEDDDDGGGARFRL